MSKTMTPDTPAFLKAKELIYKFRPLCWGGLSEQGALLENAKEAALICVSEIIEAKDGLEAFPNENEYWKSVKEEIQKL